jgi:hypothetical protein
MQAVEGANTLSITKTTYPLPRLRRGSFIPVHASPLASESESEVLLRVEGRQRGQRVQREGKSAFEKIDGIKKVIEEETIGLGI